jgi:16S rRNA (uracil1498-N3)-methyltransferase
MKIRRGLLKQFILPELPHDGVIRLSGDDYHYLVRVRRFSVGTVFKALLPDGMERRVLVQAVSAGSLVCECLASEAEMGATACAVALPCIALFQALPKGYKMDQVIRQAAEAGVSEIAPFISGYTVPRLKAVADDEKIERWKRIIREARQQSGSAIATTVRKPCSMDELLAYWETIKIQYKNAVGILLHQDRLAEGSFHSCLKEQSGFVAMVIGPEGGFSAEEADRFVCAGFTPLVLGPSVLRAETASLYAIAAIRTILLECAEWMLKTR